MPKVMTVYGTRPEAIKMAPVIPALHADSRFASMVVSTVPDCEILDQVNKRFGIEPCYGLGLMSPGQNLNVFVSRRISGLSPLSEQGASDGRVADPSGATTVQLVGVGERIEGFEPLVSEGNSSAYSACH